jgi:hypothetical protein
MRAQEFTINVPINIKINGDGDPEIDVGNDDGQSDQEELQHNPVMVPPLQQHIELAKADQGKESPVIDKLTAPHTVGDEPDGTPDDDNSELLQRIKALIAR